MMASQRRWSEWLQTENYHVGKIIRRRFVLVTRTGRFAVNAAVGEDRADGSEDNTKWGQKKISRVVLIFC